MRPLFHPQLVNDPYGDPALYIDYLFERRALMFDLGDIQRLPARKVLRVTDIFVTHAHMDHFIGFDRLLRIFLGRDKIVRLYGPPGFVAQVAHKLAAYTWNLVKNYDANLTLHAVEYHPQGRTAAARFQCREAFRREDFPGADCGDGVLRDEAQFRVRAVHLDHQTASLAYALEEKSHVNIWKNRLEELGLPTGPWLRELKAAILGGADDALPFRIAWRDGGAGHERSFPLGELRERITRIVAGHRIVYIADAAYHEANVAKMVDLAKDADLLFIESAFLQRDAAHAAAKHHLTARQAGEIARRAAAKRLATFHFSARYQGEAWRLRCEAEAAFSSR